MQKTLTRDEALRLLCLVEPFGFTIKCGSDSKNNLTVEGVTYTIDDHVVDFIWDIMHSLACLPAKDRASLAPKAMGI